MVCFVGEVLTDRQNLRHLRETQVELVHFVVAFFKSSQQVLNLKLYPFVRSVSRSVFFHFLNTLNIFGNTVGKF